MNPRHPSSIKWTALPKELTEQMISVFEEGFKKQVSKGKFIVEGRIYPKELLFRAGFLENNRLQQANFEVSLDFEPTKQNAMEQIRFAMDIAASMMEEYFSSESLDDFPRIWQKHELEKRTFYLQASTDNTELEQKANALLGMDDDRLVKSDDEAEAEEAVITMLGLFNTNDDDDLPSDDDSGSNTKH